MTFEIRNVPVGYIDLTAVDVLDPQTDRQKRLNFSGNWDLDPPEDEYFSSQTVWLLCDTIRPGLYAELNLRFSGDRLDRLYLTQGDPDSQDFLVFFSD